MAQVIKTTFQLRRGLLEVWERNNPILAKGEPSFVLDKNALKIGDGVTPWKDLEYIGLSQEDLAKAIEDYFKENPGSGTGADGRGIVSIIKTEGNSAPGTIDTYTITYTDYTTSTFTVYNGKDGRNGEPGPAGRGISSISRTSGDGAPGCTDTYTISYTDNTVSTFTVYNGKDGSAADIPRLEQLISEKASTAYVNEELDKKANSNDVYSKREVETYVSQQIAGAEHLKRLVVKHLPDISVAQTNTIYMVKKYGDSLVSWGKNIYEEYMVIEGEWELLGNSQVDLTDYAKTEYVDNKTKDKADKATTLEGYGITDAFTKGETYSRTEISELIGQITGGESAADVLAKLNEYTGTNNERVGKVEGRVETLEKAGYQANIIEGIKLADAANALTLNNKIATIPAAGASQYGLVKLSSEIGVNTAGALEIKALDLSKIVQDEEDWLILDGGTSTT